MADDVLAAAKLKQIPPVPEKQWLKDKQALSDEFEALRAIHLELVDLQHASAHKAAAAALAAFKKG